MNWIRKTKIAIKGGPGGVGVYYDKDDSQVHFHDGSVDRVATNRVAGKTQKTASYTVVLPTDNGVLFEANAATSLVFTLPAVSSANKGQRVGVVVAQLPASGSGTTITPNASDRIGYKADAATLINTAATDALGDLVILESDGVDGWIIVNKIGTWA